MNIKFNVKGSEKQVEWCKDILKDFNEFMKNIKLEDMNNNDDKNTVESYKLAEKIVNVINSEDAGIIIQQEGEFNCKNIIKRVVIESYVNVIMKYAQKTGEDQNKLFRIVKHMRKLAK